MNIASNIELQERSRRLAALVESDPTNLSLLSGAAEAALAAQQPQLARKYLDHYKTHAQLPEHEAGMAGLAAMQSGDFEAAIGQFAPLLERHPSDAALRFNLGWSYAMAKNNEKALDLLDKASAEALPQAASLRLQLLHDRGDFEAAFSEGQNLLKRHPGYAPLQAAMSVLAMDVEDTDLARTCAEQAGNHPDARTTLGILALGRQDLRTADALLSDALKAQPNAPRTLLGKGLVDLAAGNAAVAAKEIEKGAAIFESHIGSWIAAGWAYLLSNDLTASRRCFETAFKLDETFAESHGSLAVIDVAEGRLDQAKRRADVALRLDRECFSAAFAKACIVNAAGHTDVAQTIIQRALTTPIGRDGHRIADAIAGFALSRGRQQ